MAHTHGRAVFRRARAALFVVGMTLLGLVGAVLAPGIANAADANGNVVAIDAVTVDETNITDNDWVSLDVQWHVDGAAQAPITLSFTLPDWLHARTDLFTMRGGNNEAIGTCQVVQTGVTCTVDDAEYVAANPEQFHGSLEFDMQAKLGNTTPSTQTVEIGGVRFVFSVAPAPTGGEGSTEHEPYTGTKPEKFGQYLRATEPGQLDRIRWVVRVGALPDGTPIPEGQEISVSDPDVIDGMTIIAKEVIAADTVRKGKDGIEVLNFEPLPDDALTWSNGDTSVSWTSGAARSGALPEPNVNGESVRGLDGTVYEVEWMVRPNDGGAAGQYANAASFVVDG